MAKKKTVRKKVPEKKPEFVPPLIRMFHNSVMNQCQRSKSHTVMWIKHLAIMSKNLKKLKHK